MALRLPIAETVLPSALPPRVGDAPAGELLRVGDLAQRTQKTVRALHLYEELELLRPAERSRGGFRLYAPDAVLRVRWISCLQEMGFSLPEIREVLQQWEHSGSAPDAMTRIRALYAQKLEQTRRQIRRLAELRHELEASVEYLSGCEVCDPEKLISACPRCELHGDQGAPDLVAGLHGPRPE